MAKDIDYFEEEMLDGDSSGIDLNFIPHLVIIDPDVEPYVRKWVDEYNNVHIEFGIPGGIKGDTGEQGERGLIGIPGPKGDPGEEGGMEVYYEAPTEDNVGPLKCVVLESDPEVHYNGWLYFIKDGE